MNLSSLGRSGADCPKELIMRASRRLATTFAATVLLAVLTLTLAASSLPTARAEDVGLSTDRLKRINELMQRAIDANEVSGAVTIVARRGRIAHFEAQGLMDREAKTPMRKDAIFRIASMSKPVTGVAILMLMEEGKLRLTDPVSRFIPEFKNTQVAMLKNPAGISAPVSPAGGARRAPEIYTVPANREITIRDLMTHTSGLQSGGAGSAEAARLAPRNTSESLATHVPKLATVPIDFQPGTAWRYSALAGIDTLGRIVEVTSGMTFDRFLQERLFTPIGMKDTTFVPSTDRLPRVVTLYERANGGLNRIDTPSWLNTKTLFSGGGGLWSTAEDYLVFAQMLANGGEVNGHRILSPRTVDLMATNHVGDLYKGTAGNLDGMGFGLTVDVVLDNVAANARKSTGSFGWGGAFGTYYWVDRKEQIAAVMMIQTPYAPLRRDLENAVMQAIID
jgi:CubicO group peptidase (beta-lactamase class C family)